jgi:AraC-like DNA-binding protein
MSSARLSSEVKRSLQAAYSESAVAFADAWLAFGNARMAKRAVDAVAKSGKSIDAGEVFGSDLPDPLEVETVERFLRAQLPEPDPRAEEAADVVARITAKPEITRVGALARDLGTSVRQLQRLFAEYVGIGPKWVIRRYRLHEVTQRLAKGSGIDGASLAAELGYADQAHFARDFKEMFGEPPTCYAERY